MSSNTRTIPDCIELIERESYQNKRLIYDRTEGNLYVYKLVITNKETGQFDYYMRVIFDCDLSTIKVIDFDGGPMIGIGSEIYNNYKIAKFKYTDDRNIEVYLQHV